MLCNTFLVLSQTLIYIFSPTADNIALVDDIALVDNLYVVGEVMLVLKGIYMHASEKCSFINMLHSIVLFQLLP